MAELDGPTREVKLIVDHRRTLGAERTPVQNRLRWQLHELHAEPHVRSRGLHRYKVMNQLEGGACTVRRPCRAAGP